MSQQTTIVRGHDHLGFDERERGQLDRVVRVWFLGSGIGYGRYLSAANMSGKERLLAREPGTLTLQDVARDGRVLVTRDVPRVGMVGLTAGSSKERDLSWMDWSAPKDLSADGKTLLFTESGEAGGENYASYLRQTDGSPAVRLGDGVLGETSVGREDQSNRCRPARK